jgi:hypothetical protein
MWYEEQLEKVNKANLRAEIYFDEQRKTNPLPPDFETIDLMLGDQ